MEQVLCLMGLIFLVIVAFAFQQQQKESATQRILDYIQQQGGTAIELSSAYDRDRDTMTFVVSYYDRYGGYQQTRCKVRYRNLLTGRDHDLYWTHDPAIAAPTVDKLVVQSPGNLEPTISTGFQAHPFSSKEQIIADLTAENERLRAEIEALRQQVSRWTD